MNAVRWIRRSATPALLLLVAGCAGLTGSRDNRPAVGPASSQIPSAQNLIDYVNANAARVGAIEADDVALDVKAGNQGGGLSGVLYCEKPKNFRLRARAVGQPMADFGSNSNEFWYWISKENPPYVYHCDYTDLARGNVNLPFPFQPDWVLETLGMGSLTNPIEGFRVERKGDKFELIERATATNGRPVHKVTVFHAGNTTGGTPQITAYRLHDERGQAVALAEVVNVRRDAATGAVVPQHIRLKWPQQKLEMEMKLDGLKVYAQPVLAQRAPDIFQRPTMRDVPSFDLARGAPDARPSNFQRTGGRQ